MNHDKSHSCGCACGRAHPVDVLSEEHRTILGVLAAAEREVERVEAGRPLRLSFWHGYLDFMEHYADRCHHGKEEDVLFAELEQNGLPRDMGPTHCMRTEHDTMRAGRRRLTELLTGDDLPAICRAARSGIDMLREHIEKEDHVLFPMAKSMLPHDAVQRVREGFARVEHVDMGEGAHCRYEALAKTLCNDPEQTSTV